MKTLHITNGDGAAGILKASEVPGDVLPWRDPMHHGPFPAGLSVDDLRKVRARYLVGPGQDPNEAIQDFRLRDEHLQAAKQYNRIILWFEHDLLDQLQILQILDALSTTDPEKTVLEMICINSFPGFDTFRGIGQLTPTQMGSLMDQRKPVTPDVLDLAREGWQAFRSDDPRHLAAYCDNDLQCLPFLRAALLRHFAEYPSVQNGLTRTESQILRLVQDGVHAPQQLFVQNMDQEAALYIGDWRTYAVIQFLCEAGLLACTPSPFWYGAMTAEDRDAFKEQRVNLTDNGAAVLDGKTDLAAIADRDQWLGGVHIRFGQPHWRWDADEGEVAWHQT